MKRDEALHQQGGTVVAGRESPRGNQRSRWGIYLYLVGGLLALAWGFSQYVGWSVELGDEGWPVLKFESDQGQIRADSVTPEKDLMSETPPAALQSEPIEAEVEDQTPRTREYTRVITQPKVIGDYTAEDLQRFKKHYSCDLAREARESCEIGYADPHAYDRCLSLRQYYSYSRHCGFQP